MEEVIQPQQQSDIDFSRDVPQYTYDNEWVKFMSDLSKNESTEDLATFIKHCEWSTRQQNTIMAYCRIILGRGLGTTFLREGTVDMYVLRDKKAIADCDLYLGLVRVDITPEFNELIDLIDAHFFLESQKSIGGFYIKRAGLQRIEVEREDKKHQGLGGVKQRLFGE